MDLTPAQRAEADAVARQLREARAINATTTIAGAGPVVVWQNGTVERDHFA